MVPKRSRISSCLRRWMYSSSAAVTAAFLVAWWPIWRADSIRVSSMARLVATGHPLMCRVPRIEMCGMGMSTQKSGRGGGVASVGLELVERQANVEAGSVGFGVDAEVAAVFADDAHGVVESESESESGGFGGEEWFEDAVL
uniref:Uncharacterized protein n=1 Tax=mine drainage metagenome TaxID=410659 RepID=E6QI90_9ZZZZ